MKSDFHEWIYNMRTGDADTRALTALTVLDLGVLLAFIAGWI